MNGLEINEKICSYCYFAEDRQSLERITHHTITVSVDPYESCRRITMQGEQADACVCRLAKSLFRSPISF